jgi:hypothetical protein
LIQPDDSKCVFIEENGVNGGGTHTQEKCKTIKESKPRQELTLKKCIQNWNSWA